MSVFLKHLLLIVGSAAGGSAMGALLTGWSESALGWFLPTFSVSFVFTLVGASLLTTVGFVLGARLDGTWPAYFPIALFALVAGPLMTILVFGPGSYGAFLGGVFAFLTAIVWVLLHRVLGLSAVNHRV